MPHHASIVLIGFNVAPSAIPFEWVRIRVIMADPGSASILAESIRDSGEIAADSQEHGCLMSRGVWHSAGFPGFTRPEVGGSDSQGDKVDNETNGSSRGFLLSKAVSTSIDVPGVAWDAAAGSDAKRELGGTTVMSDRNNGQLLSPGPHGAWLTADSLVRPRGCFPVIWGGPASGATWGIPHRTPVSTFASTELAATSFSELRARRSRESLPCVACQRVACRKTPR